MLLLGIARDMIEAQVAKPRRAPPARQGPDMALVYPGTTVEPAQLRRLIDESFLYLSESQRKEIFDSLHEALKEQKNAALRSPMIHYFAEKAVTVRAAQEKLAQLSSGEKESLAADFRKEIAGLSADEQAQLGELLRNGLLPLPSDLNQMLLAAFDAPR
jgi:hypothetical protein